MFALTGRKDHPIRTDGSSKGGGMKLLRGVVLGLVVVGLVALFSGLASAEEECVGGMKGKMMSHEGKMKVMQDAAVALEKTNPELSKQLNDYVAMKTKKMEEMKVNQEQKTKMLQDAAAALEKSNPELSKELQDMCEGKAWGMEKKGMMMEKKGMMEKKEMMEPMTE